MLPENQGIERTCGRGDDPHHAAGYGYVAGSSRAERANRAAQRIRAGPAAEQRRVRHSKTLRSQRFIPADHIGHPQEIYVLGGLIQFVEQGLQY
jgi:alkanesulfonate monooxygenase SsuD/methylene tetrahydromethanopterin reductase-like flavin-dependent oxidoreductase (luciferase family)